MAEVRAMSKEILGLLLAFGAFIATLALYLIDKAGKNNPAITIGILILMAALALGCVYLVPWVWPSKLAERIWRVSLVTSAVLLLVGRFGIWVWPEPSKPTPPQMAHANGITFVNSRCCQLTEFHKPAPSVTIALACFRNDSRFMQYEAFNAHIIYRDIQGNEIGDLARATWLPADSDHPTRTYFETGITKNLAAIVIEGDTPKVPVIGWIRQTLGRQRIGLPEMHSRELPSTLSTLEVRLLGLDRDPIVFHLKWHPGKVKPFSLQRRD